MYRVKIRKMCNLGKPHWNVFWKIFWMEQTQKSEKKFKKASSFSLYEIVIRGTAWALFFHFETFCLEISFAQSLWCVYEFLKLFFNVLRDYIFFSEPWESLEKNEKQVPGHLYATAIENLRPFTQYKARIKATNNLGTGPPSSVIAVKIWNSST